MSVKSHLEAVETSEAAEDQPLLSLTRWMVPIAIGLTIVFWASAFTGIRIALADYTPEQLAFLRYLLASLILLAYALISRMPLPRLKDIPGLALCGLIGFAVYNVTLNAGERTVSPGVASFIVSAEIGGIALLAALFMSERIGRLGKIGIILCILGVGIISLSGEESLQLSPDAFLIVIAMVAISIYSVMQKPFLKRYTALQFITYAMWAGTVFLFFTAPNALSVVSQAPLNSTLAIVYMAIFPGIVAYLCWSYVLAHIPAARAGSYLALIPIVATGIAWVWLEEVPSVVALVGGIVIFVGVMLVNRKEPLL